TYMPRLHNPERSIWRGLEAMLPSVVSAARHKDGPPQFRSPGVLDWLSDLSREGFLPSDQIVRTWVVGVAYGAQNATFKEIVDDRLTLRVVLLREDQPALGALADGAVKDAEGTATAVARLARNIAQAAGASKDSSGPESTARERLYAALDRPYRDWLASLSSETDILNARTRWQAIVLREARTAATELVRSASPAAWVGREVNKQLVNVARAEAWFYAELRKVLGTAFTRRETPPLEAAS
ncbi:MAG TPA: type I-E CRISPR-associated protein Cse1/CasA, partial [Micromonosporaceae bacterium]